MVRASLLSWKNIKNFRKLSDKTSFSTRQQLLSSSILRSTLKFSKSILSHTQPNELEEFAFFLPGCLLSQPTYLHFLEKHKEKDRVIKYLTITRDIYHHLLVWSRKTSWPTENKRQDTQSRNCSGFKGKCTPRKIRTFVLNLAEVKNVYVQAKWHIKLEIFPVSGAGSDLE